LKHVFAKIDTNGNGNLSGDEVVVAAKAYFARTKMPEMLQKIAYNCGEKVYHEKEATDNKKGLNLAEFGAFLGEVMKDCNPYNNLFNAADTDNSGTLSPQEIGIEAHKQLATSGLPGPMQDIAWDCGKERLEELKDNSLDRGEFRHWLRGVLKNCDPYEIAFNHTDTNKNGYLSPHEAVTAAEHWVKDMAWETAKECGKDDFEAAFKNSGG